MILPLWILSRISLDKFVLVFSIIWEIVQKQQIGCYLQWESARWVHLNFLCSRIYLFNWFREVSNDVSNDISNDVSNDVSNDISYDNSMHNAMTHLIFNNTTYILDVAQYLLNCVTIQLYMKITAPDSACRLSENLWRDYNYWSLLKNCALNLLNFLTILKGWMW